MSKPTILYELDTLVTDDLTASISQLAEAVERDEHPVEQAVLADKEKYERGEITQSEYWGSIALKLALEDIEVIGAIAQNESDVNMELLGRIRAQSPLCTLGLISDATPDWVGHFRKTYQLDELIHVHVIGSELDEEHAGLDYRGLLKLSAERLQGKPADIAFVDQKSAHLKIAKDVGYRNIDLANVPDLKTAFAGIT
ncbi:hypothetical protein EXS54_00650 [Patescibacteria group bacterium]|nr:hypothetical protein [Patescibacteria group bacterium]